MWNLVSEQWLGADQAVEWYHSPVDLTINPVWIPAGQSPAQHPGLGGLGPAGRQFPLGTDVTLLLAYKQATIETVQVVLSLFAVASLPSTGGWGLGAALLGRPGQIQGELVQTQSQLQSGGR